MFERCSTARVARKRFSTVSGTMSRTSELEIPALAVAVQAMISRSKVSMMTATRIDPVIPEGELQTIRAPARVRAHDHDPSVVDAAFANRRMCLKQHRGVIHDPMNPLSMDDRFIDGSA